ncbi:Hsp70 family protein [Metabacillus fastidiosus]|uniref:Hsp70 family protein n=1 Tax=Metabacillus fastidiosus TaxID=1458 RepID=UPI002DBC5737|nr:Hsp70 family protein [Metabacillus fastidiosus]MEC2075951.1 Hsp70 family protein [Metabacillus fastidiosus]
MKVGIDLGTTNCAVAYIDENGIPQIVSNREGERTTPSVVYFEEGTAVVGKSAKLVSVTDPENTVQFVKRQMGNPDYKFPLESGDKLTPEELSAIILKRLIEDAEESLGGKITDVVITVPAYFNDVQRKATQDAGKLAGVNVLKVINEPTAAALAYGLGRKENKEQTQNILVYDLGGGTFDVTVMSLSADKVRIRATGGDKNLGGFDFDNSIFNYVADQLEEEHGIDIYDDEVAMQELREKSEDCKKVLKTRKKAIVNISSQGKSSKITITKEQFDSMISSLLNRTVLIMKGVLEDAVMDWNDIDKILLVGGSTRINTVSEVIESASGITPSSELNPDEVVAIGAAIQAQLLSSSAEYAERDHKNRAVTKVIDVNSHSLGILVFDDKSEGKMNSIILPKNTEIPADISKTYYTSVENQTELHIEVTEGDSEDPHDVQIIGDTYVKLAGNAPLGSPLEFTVSYDESGVVHVFAKDRYNNEDLGEILIERKSNLSELEINEKSSKLLNFEIE